MEARKDMRKSPLPKPRSILGALLGARGGASKSPNRKNRKSANMEEKWVLMVKLTIFAKLNAIPNLLLQMSFPWFRGSKAYETQGILGVLGRPSG